MSRYFAEHGWGVDAITLDPASVAAADCERLKDLPAGTRVFGVPARPLLIESTVSAAWKRCAALVQRVPRLTAANRARSEAQSRHGEISSAKRAHVRWNLSSFRGVTRAYAAWISYEREARWTRDATAVGLSIFDPRVHRAVITSGPPHMTHEGGRLVARATGLPFVMDMRDPWSLAERLDENVASPLWFRMARYHERRAAAQAAVIVTNTEPFAQAMRRSYPEVGDRIVTVMNGYDDGPSPEASRPERFTIAYAGEIYIDRDPRPLFRAAARVIREFGLTPRQFGIDFIGDVETFGSVPVRELARREGVDGFVSTGPARPHREAMKFLAGAAMLVSLPQDSVLAIPAKIFEYMRFEAWLLALATPESAAGRVLRDTGADVVQPHDIDAIADVLRTRFLQHRDGVRPTTIASETGARFNRRSQAEILLRAIEACAMRRGDSAAADDSRAVRSESATDMIAARAIQ